jgi:purine-cytosine permease-like protein
LTEAAFKRIRLFMMFFALWLAFGALAGWFVGIHRCADISRYGSKNGRAVHIGFCASVGALIGFAVFLLLGSLLYGREVLSN